MKPGKLDLPTIWRGCDWGPVTLRWRDLNGDPLDLTGWQAVAQSLNVDLNPSITDVVGGETQLSLTKDDTAILKLGVENWDFVWQHFSGNYRYPPFLSGKVYIKEPVSGTNGSTPPPPPPLPPDTPVAIAATGIFGNRFNANWLVAARAAGYRLDVSPHPSFDTFVPGFQNLNVGNVLSYLVTGLDPLTTYHYRVRAHNAGGGSSNSNVVNVTTAAPPVPPNDNFLDNVRMAGLQGTLHGTTLGATRETGEPGGINSVWYWWRPDAVVEGIISLNNIENVIGIWKDHDPAHPAVNNLDHVATSVINGGEAIVTFQTLPATTYRVRVHEGAAPFNIHWTYTI